ncbi:YdaU family protein [Undibacterium sp. JH2W]|uniref:YdaU family protein n=1 Tax=Undibacterium sp. JH2W TaxID=3413037 RepID=UPI003BF0E2E3
MNYYPFHLGDYASHTRHLGLLEDLAYRRMLDLYYTTEAALPVDAEKVARLIGMRQHLQEVSDVLSDFFVISDAGHTHSRCEEELALYWAKADRAKSANKARWGGGRKQVSTDADEEFVKSESRSQANSYPASDTDSSAKAQTNSQRTQIATNNQEPVSKNHKPVNNQPVKKIKPKSRTKAAATPQQCDEYFEYAWEDYPKTSACNKNAAYQAWNARLAEGASVSRMLGGAGCYGSFVQDKQVELDAVMNVSVFFGREKHYLQDWEKRPLWKHEDTYFDEGEY